MDPAPNHSSLGGPFERIEPPYGIILDELGSGNAIAFLGAAASRVGWKPGESAFLPSGEELAEILARDSKFPSSDLRERSDLAKVSSYYVDGSNRGALRRRLRRVFVDEHLKSNDLHRLLAAVANNLMIVTTNYDTLLEEAFLEVSKPFELFVYPADNEEFANGVLWWPHEAKEPTTLKSNELDINDFKGKNVIYKIHGSVAIRAVDGRRVEQWDSFVITEEDYVRFLSGMSNAVPPAFLDYFRTRAFLFLGYGLKDWNMRVLLKEVSVPGRVSWAILHQPSPFERKLWERRRVDIFDLTLEDFVVNLQKEIQGRR